MWLALFIAASPELFVSPAVRCNECHEKMVREWRTSAHARAAKSPEYTAMRAIADKSGIAVANRCDKCHAPFAAVTGVSKGIAQEGVTCDVCHTLKSVTPAPDGAALSPQIEDNVKYGPLCDAKAHYFHKMGCSPLHTKAEICGGCHSFQFDGVAVFTEYDEWKKDAAGDKDAAPCQSCHMPGSTSEVAKGSPKRKNVPHHGLKGAKNDLFRDALSLIVRVSEAGVGLRVTTELTNDGAPHGVPAGLPGRRVVLRVKSVAEGRVLDDREVEYGRIHKDGSGVEAPFFLAKSTEDTRLKPNMPDKRELMMPKHTQGEVEIEVVRQSLSPRLAELLSVKAEETVLLKTSIPYSSKKPLPRTVTVTKGK